MLRARKYQCRVMRDWTDSSRLPLKENIGSKKESYGLLSGFGQSAAKWTVVQQPGSRQVIRFS